ncbi:MAG: glycoside hydrolase family 3 protein, partial [Acidimicrobiales bacterium]
VASLTLEEKGRLTAGGDMFATAAIERLGVPRVNVTDGPSGARGQSFPGVGGPPSSCLPCGSAIGASWDPRLAEALGALAGREALDRGCLGLLAPTLNLHRSPLAGRNFECYSEDPLLTGRLGAAYVRGVQAQGVFATAKHFVANEAEFERTTINSVVDERALRELYLLPFELAVKEGGALAIMTAYNRVNGRWVTEQHSLLIDLLRDEWGFGGLVMTDWFAVADTAESLAAGLDLEMPGPGRALGATVVDAIDAGTVQETDLDEAVRRLLEGLDKIGALDRPEPACEPQPQRPEDQVLLRRAAAESIVLLRNDGTLPIDPGAVPRIAVIGPAATGPCVVGGGSAGVVLHPLTTPLEALTAALGDAGRIVHERGVEIDRSPRVVGGEVLRAPEGFEVERFAGPDLDGPVVARQHLDELRHLDIDLDQQAGDTEPWSMRVTGTVLPDESGSFELALAQAGSARLFVDGVLVLDGFTDAPPSGGADFFGQASEDIVAEVELRAGQPVELVVEFSAVNTTMAGFRIGFRSSDGDVLLERAVTAAAGADVTVVFVGTTAEWETEGKDRTSWELPGRQEELIRRVAAVCPHTVVVVNAASPVDLSWVDDVAAVLVSWFGGEQMGPALADVLVGAADPGGRLPTTFPFRLEHSPSHDNFPGDNGELRYGESLFMGYRGFDHRAIEPRFPFGAGLSYTTFALGDPVLSSDTFTPGGSMSVSVPVTNTGTRAGSEVIQCYVAPAPCRLPRPPKELKAFVKVHLDAGESTIVELTLDDRAFAYWDPGQAEWAEIAGRVESMFGIGETAERRPPGWQVDPGPYQLVVGTSSRNLLAPCVVEVDAGP